LTVSKSGLFIRPVRLLAKGPSFTHNSQKAALWGIMSVTRFNHFHFGLMIATALACAMWPAAGEAYTPEEEQACSGDAFRLCSSDIPDVDRVTACMVRNQSQLSPGCRVYFRPEPALTQVTAGGPLSIRPANSRKPVGVKPRKPKKPAKKPAKPDAT
jgi:hypothetical protein